MSTNTTCFAVNEHEVDGTLHLGVLIKIVVITYIYCLEFRGLRRVYCAASTLNCSVPKARNSKSVLHACAHDFCSGIHIGIFFGAIQWIVCNFTYGCQARGASGVFLVIFRFCSWNCTDIAAAVRSALGRSTLSVLPYRPASWAVFQSGNNGSLDDSQNARVSAYFGGEGILAHFGLTTHHILSPFLILARPLNMIDTCTHFVELWCTSV